MSITTVETVEQGNRPLRQREELRVTDLWLTRPLHWLLVIVIAAAGVVAALFYTWHAPVLYTASATVKLNQDVTGVGLRDFSGSAQQTGTGPEFMLDMLTLQEVLTSEATAETVIDRLHLLDTAPYNTLSPDRKNAASVATDPSLPTAQQPPAVRDRALAIFHAGLNVSPVKNTRLMTVSYTDKDPQRATKIANTIVVAYADNASRGRGSATSATALALRAQIADLQQTVEKNAREISDLEERTHLVGSAPLLGPDQCRELYPKRRGQPGLSAAEGA